MAKINGNYEVVYIIDPAQGEEAVAATKLVTDTPDWVVRSSGSRTRRPITIMRFNMWNPPYSPLQTIMERRIPSVMPSTRSEKIMWKKVWEQLDFFPVSCIINKLAVCRLISLLPSVNGDPEI